MNHQLSYEMSRCHHQDLMRTAERARLAAEVTGQATRSRRLRWTIPALAPRTARALFARARVA